MKLLFRESKSLSARGRERVYELDRAYVGLWRELLRERLAAGEGREARADLLANCIYYLCTVWALRHWAIGGHGLAALEEAACDLVLHGVLGSGEA